MKNIILTLAAVILICSAAFGASDANSASTNKITITGTGDSAELLRTLATAFEAKHSGTKIKIPESIGSTAGIKAVIADKADLARTARELKDAEKYAGVTQVVFAKTPIVFVVRWDTNDINNITTQQIFSIYKGEIKNWSQLGVKPGKIYPLTREAGDSALSVLGKTLPGFADVNSPAAKVMYLTPEAVSAMLDHKQTIGFLPLSAVINTKLKILKVDGIEPSSENVLNGEYKHVIPLGIACKGQPAGLAKEFIDFLYSEDAAEIVRSTGAVPVKAE
ncbi:MAG: substrate-binding domain-containing protein [Planctomycetaceae bacterium]|nr:substrate-binding domain-containing protein [Planctomycetaceae bacterium]